MSHFDLFIGDKESMYVGIQYSGTGVFGYSFRKGGVPVYSISNSVLPKPDIYLSGFDQKLVHREYDGQMTLIRGVRRTIADESGKEQGHFEFAGEDGCEFRIAAGNIAVSVKTLKNGWKVFDGKKRLASILRIPEDERSRFEENGFDMEERFLIHISKETDLRLYPYIMAIPVLGF